MCDSAVCYFSDESGFGDWIDEKVRIILPHYPCSCLRQEDAGESSGQGSVYFIEPEKIPSTSFDNITGRSIWLFNLSAIIPLN